MCDSCMMRCGSLSLLSKPRTPSPHRRSAHDEWEQNLRMPGLSSTFAAKGAAFALAHAAVVLGVLGLAERLASLKTGSA